MPWWWTANFHPWESVGQHASLMCGSLLARATRRMRVEECRVVEFQDREVDAGRHRPTVADTLLAGRALPGLEPGSRTARHGRCEDSLPSITTPDPVRFRGACLVQGLKGSG